MPIAFGRTLGTGAINSSGTTLVITTTQPANVGEWIVVRVATDNLSATTPTYACADSAGNTYTVDRQAARVATAGAGIAGAVISAPVTSPLPIGGTITITLSGATFAKAAVAQAFTGVGGRRASGAADAGGVSTAPSVTLTTPESGDLVIGHIAHESFTAPSAYDTDTTNGSWSTGAVHPSATSGTDNQRVQVIYQHKIVTGTGSQTYNATVVSADWFAFEVAYTPSVETHSGGSEANVNVIESGGGFKTDSTPVSGNLITDASYAGGQNNRDNAGFVGPYCPDGTDIYVVAESKATNDKLIVSKSTDGGATWTTMDSANSPLVSTNGDMVAIASVLYGTVIHIATSTDAYSTSFTDIHYHTFDTATDLWVVKNELVQAPNMGAASQVEDIEIAVRSQSGLPVIFHQTVPYISAGSWVKFELAVRTAPNTYTRVLLRDIAQDQQHIRMIADPETNDIHIFWQEEPSQAHLAATFRGDTNDISTPVVLETAHSVFTSARPITWLDGATRRYLFGAYGGANVAVRRMVEDVNGDITTDLAVADIQDADSDADAGNRAMAWDAINSKAYVFWQRNVDKELVYDAGSNGTNWGADQVATTDAFVDGVWANYYVRGGSSYIGYVWCEDSLGTNQLRFDEIPIVETPPEVGGVEWVATGVRTSGAAGTTTSTVQRPTTGNVAGNLTLIGRSIKPSTATGSAESGWTQLASVIGGTGTSAADTGPTRTVVDYQQLVGGESGGVVWDQANTPNAVASCMITYRRLGTAAWEPIFTSADDSVHDTGRAGTGAAISLRKGDVIVAFVGSDTDDATAFTSPVISAPGMTITTTERLGAGGVTTNNDAGISIYEGIITDGEEAVVAPTLSLSGGPSNCGPIVFVRLRSGTPAAPITESGGATAIVVVPSDGTGRKTSQGGSTEIVTVPSDGAGQASRQGGSEANVNTVESGSGRKTSLGGSTELIGVAAEGGGSVGIPEAKSGGSEANVNVLDAGAGRKTVAAGSTSFPKVDSESGGQKTGRGGTTEFVQAGADGSGRKAGRGGVTEIVQVGADGGTGTTTRRGSATARINVDSTGTGVEKSKGGSTGRVEVDTEAAGSKAVTGGVTEFVQVNAEGAGTPSVVIAKSGGSTALVNALSDGVGRKAISQGSTSFPKVDTEAAGQKISRGGFTELIHVLSDGTGRKLSKSGATEIIGVLVDGVGSKWTQDGSTALVRVDTQGGGSMVGVDPADLQISVLGDDATLTWTASPNMP